MQERPSAWPWTQALLPFGDAEGAKDLLRQVAQGTPLGRIIGSGVYITGRVFGSRRVPSVRGKPFPDMIPGH